MSVDLYDPFGVNNFYDDLDHHSESDSPTDEFWDKFHPPYDPQQQQKPVQRPEWWIKSTIRSKWNTRGLIRFKDINQITHTTIDLTQQHTELNYYLNPYPIVKTSIRLH